MRRFLNAAAAVALASGALVWSSGASVAATPNPCNTQGWFVNDDEKDREPDRTLDGFVFEGSDLIHHAASVRLSRLKPGWFTATPAPDQPSFFSVEIRDLTTDAYGTLRWNKTTAQWDLVANGVLHSHADPEDFVGTDTKWGKITENARVVTFGVGYTKSPPGTVKTTVSAVNFMGRTHKLGCPAPTSSPSSSTSASSSPSPSSTVSATPSSSSTRTSTPTSSATPFVPLSPAAGSGSDLPNTGASLTGVVLGGATLVLIGAALAWKTRRRKA